MNIKNISNIGNSKGIIIPSTILDIWTEYYGVEIKTVKFEFDENLKLVIVPFIPAK